MVVTAQLGDLTKEISLVLRTGKGLILITGCSHPGLDVIMQNASQFGKIYAVMGGFHGFSKLEAIANVPRIMPAHCTQKKQEIQNSYPRQTHLVAAGMEIHVLEEQR